MRIGLLTNHFPPEIVGGAELQIKQLAGQLAQAGHEVVVFTRFNSQPDKGVKYRICGRSELPLPMVRLAWDLVRVVWDIARCQPRPDVLLCYQTINSGLIGTLAQSVLGIPAVVSIRGNKEYRLADSWWNRVLVPPVYRRAHSMIVQSPRLEEDLLEHFQRANQMPLAETVSQKLKVIPNGIHLPPVLPSTGKKVVYVGRLIHDKGVADLLSAIRALPGVETLIIGDGPARGDLEQLAKGLNVEFAGMVDPASVPKYLRQARLLVLPSRLGDGFPNVLLEAMALGVPVVATRTAGIPDLIDHEQSGLLVDPRDTKDLATQIKRLFEDDELHHRLAREGRTAAEAYGWDEITPQIEAILEDARMSVSQPSFAGAASARPSEVQRASRSSC